MSLPLTPWQSYQDALASGNYEADPAQAYAMQELDQLFYQVNSTSSRFLLPQFLQKSRLLSKLAPVSKGKGGSEHRTGVYTQVHEDSSTEPTHKILPGAKFNACKCAASQQNPGRGFVHFSTGVEFRKKSSTSNHLAGVYLYGEVGAGKTWMMDLFYQCLQKKKQRFHFHQFMREVHRELKILQGHKNPLRLIAKRLAKRAKVICFDELFVNDIADAMLLGELFYYMFAHGIYFIITSNRPPDDLYLNGLQRSRFYPAIELLKNKLQLIKVQSLKDYRWRQALSKGVYFYPLNQTTAEAIQTLFAQLTAKEIIQHKALEINQRFIACVAYAQDVLWCNFVQLCHTPRSVQDYVSLSKRFKIFILDQVPLIQSQDDNAIWYLISLVDVLYDARCRLVLRAAVAPQSLYQGDKLKFEFQRTLSRLQEMQTQTYWT